MDEIADAKILAKLNDLDKGYFEKLDADLADAAFKNAIENKPGLVGAWKVLDDIGDNAFDELRKDPDFLNKFNNVVKNKPLNKHIFDGDISYEILETGQKK